MKENFVSRKSDLIGIMGSLACMVHCLALPALFYFFQLTLDGDQNEYHHLLEYAFVAIAAVAVITTVRKSGSPLLKGFLVIALALFSGGVLFESVLSFADVMLHVGSLGLVLGHAYNIRRSHFRSPRPKGHPSPVVVRGGSPSPSEHPLPAYSDVVASRAC
jgi:hypothetical protein